MSYGDIRAKIASDDEFGNNDIMSTPLAITTIRELKSSVEIGVNTTCKGGSLMLNNKNIIVQDDWIKSFHNLDIVKNNDLIGGWLITMVTYD